MADEKKVKLSLSVYKALVARLPEIGIRSFEKEEDGEDHVVKFQYTGEDLPMTIYLIVDTDRQMLRAISPLPVRFSTDQLAEGAKAVCAANDKIVNGRFDLNMRKGNVSFTLCAPFEGSVLSDKIFDYMVGVTINTVDDYNDKLFMVAKGMMDAEGLISKLYH